MFTQFDAFDLAESLYFWLQDNWLGQTDSKYSDFCRLIAPGMFKPGAGLSRASLSEEGQVIYNQLLNDDNYTEALDVVLNYWRD